MTTKKTRFSINHDRSSQQCDEIDNAVDSLKVSDPGELSEEYLELLSDLGRPAAQRLAERWMEIEHPVRLDVVQELVNRFESDIEHHYDRALVAALVDESADVKLRAFDGLTDTSDRGLLSYLLNRLPAESDARVRAAGALVFGQFVLESELEKLPDDDARRVCDVVVSLASHDPEAEVRRRALESAGYLADHRNVTQLITDAWQSGQHEAQVSALRAMGRQSDPRWLDIILEEFVSDEPELRFEAARAAGTVGGQRVAARLIDLTEDDDVEVQTAAIESLGAIGGDVAINALRNLEHSESIAISDAASAALEDALLAHSTTRPPNTLW